MTIEANALLCCSRWAAWPIACAATRPRKCKAHAFRVALDRFPKAGCGSGVPLSNAFKRVRHLPGRRPAPNDAFDRALMQQNG